MTYQIRIQAQGTIYDAGACENIDLIRTAYYYECVHNNNAEIVYLFADEKLIEMFDCIAAETL